MLVQPDIQNCFNTWWTLKQFPASVPNRANSTSFLYDDALRNIACRRRRRIMQLVETINLDQVMQYCQVILSIHDQLYWDLWSRLEAWFSRTNSSDTLDAVLDFVPQNLHTHSGLLCNQETHKILRCNSPAYNLRLRSKLNRSLWATGSGFSDIRARSIWWRVARSALGGSLDLPFTNLFVSRGSCPYVLNLSHWNGNVLWVHSGVWKVSLACRRECKTLLCTWHSRDFHDIKRYRYCK